MTTTTPTPADHRTSDVAADPAPAAGRRVPFAVVVAGSMLSGLVNTLVLVLVVFAGATEPVITGAGLLGLASGWALLAVLTTRWTSQPQRWAAVPAAVHGRHRRRPARRHPRQRRAHRGRLGVAAGRARRWPSGWCAPARRATTGRSGWLLYPVIGRVAVTAVGGAVETVTLARDHGRYAMPGALYDVGGHRLHLTCTGTGSPTVVLENGLERDLAAVERHHRAGRPGPPGSAPTTGPVRAGATTSPTRRTASPSPPTCTPCWPAPASTARTSWPGTPPAAPSP